MRPDPSRRRIGVLSLHNSKETKAICNAVEALGHEPVWLRGENVSLRIDDDEPVLEPDVDLVVNRLLLTNAASPLDDLEIATTLASAYPVLNAPDAVLRAIHKYATAMTLAEAGVPTPNSTLLLDPAGPAPETDHLSPQAVNKPAIGTHGDDAWRVAEGDERRRVRLDSHSVYQSFLEQDSVQSDVRVYVVAGEIVAAMRRTASGDDWRANVARGGTTADATGDLSDRVRGLALRATGALGLDVAGVDLMEHDGEWYVIEVNPTAGFRGLFDATGRSPAPYIARAAIERVDGAVDEDAVDELASTLDDSVPACKPDSSDSARETETIGATETVTLEGRDGAEQVVAKVDTGADRTSVDVEVAAAIGAGPITEYATVRSASRDRSTTRPLVDVYLSLGGRWESVTASVEDRSHMNYPVILGKDVLSGYRIDIDRRAEGACRTGREGGATRDREE
ncbi:MAG: RimK/LysX family protein [Haloferacaceae archaeon]